MSQEFDTQIAEAAKPRVLLMVIENAYNRYLANELTLEQMKDEVKRNTSEVLEMNYDQLVSFLAGLTLSD